MKLLLIHTCGVEGSVAIADEEGVRAAAALAARAASEELMPAVRRLLEEVGWGVGELGAVGVVRGPGTFTGVRTGWSVGKGLCEALGISLVGVSRLELLAGSGGGVVNAVLDAGRGQFYLGRFRDGVLEREALVEREELQGEGRWVGCEAKVAETLGIDVVAEPSAGNAFGLVMRGVAEGVNDVLRDALYLRQTDAEIFAKPAGRAG